jgi:ABC-type transporter Mla MlaB component
LPSQEGRDVLRITEVSRSDSAITFKLEGKLLAPWVEELRRICTEAPHESRQIRLDLDAVSFVDATGVELMRDLIRQGIAIAQCSGFVAELLHVDRKYFLGLVDPGAEPESWSFEPR